MGLEAATYINQLDALNPEFDDVLREADDHMRLIKSTLLNTFPIAAGAMPISGDGSNLIGTGGLNVSGAASLGNYVFDTAQALGPAVDTYALVYDDVTGFISLEERIAVWGSLTGTLSNQLDLQAELDGKTEEAPSDGTPYARQDAAWVSSPLTPPGGLVNQVQLNDGAGGFAGGADFVWNNALLVSSSAESVFDFTGTVTEGFTFQSATIGAGNILRVVNTSTALTEPMVYMSQQASSGGNTNRSTLELHNAHNGANVLEIGRTGVNTSGNLVELIDNVSTSANLIQAATNSLTSGSMMLLTHSGVGMSNQMMWLNGSNASQTGSALRIDSAGSGVALRVFSSGTGLSFQTDADINIGGNIVVAGTVDGIDLQTQATAIGLNTAKVTNATHTGQVTGATALSLGITAITDQPASGAVVGTDTMLINDGGTLSEVTLTQLETFLGGVSATNNTFTPTIIGSTTAGVGTYGSQHGSYTKIGDMVFAQVYLSWTAHTGTGTSMRIAGMPFTSENVSDQFTPATFFITDITLNANSVIQGYMLHNTTEITLQQYVSGGGAASNVALDTAGTIMVSIAYRAA